MKILLSILLVASLIATGVMGVQLQRAKAQALSIHSTVNIKVTDPVYGTVVDRTFKMGSFVRGFMDLIYPHIAYKTLASVPDVTNTIRTVTYIVTTYPVISMTGAAGSNVQGIVVGTGTNAVTMADYALQTIVANGSGAGQLNYSDTTFYDPATSGNTRTFSFSRSFFNNSGDSITVNETGVYVAYKYSTSTYYFLGIRDLVGGGQAIANLQTMTVTYSISITL